MIASLVIWTGPLVAQTAPAPSGASASEAAIKLDPFSVQADSDVGFVAASSLAGGRIATALKDTPVAYSVMTKEFLDAFNLTDAADAAQYSVNVQYSTVDGSNQGFAASGGMNSLSGTATDQPMQIRGQNTASPQRNFFPVGGTADNFNADRVDVTRGPNSVLFGIGNGGGSINTNTKQALVNRDLQELRLQVGSFNRYRFTLDTNKVITPKIAARLNLLYQTGDTWRDHEWEDRKGLHLTGTYRPTQRLTLRSEVEYRSTRRLQAWQTLTDLLTGWDGKTYIDGANPGITASQMAQYGVFRFPLHFVNHPSWGNNFINYENTYTTDSARYNAPPAQTGFLNGKPVNTVGFGNETRYNTTYPMDNLYWKSPELYAAVQRGTPYWRLFAPEENTLWTDPRHRAPSYTEVTRSATAYATYTLGESLFIEAAGDINETPRMGRNDGRRGLQGMSIDISRVRPDGTPNPDFMRMFSDAMPFVTLREENYRNLRLQAAYVKETRFGKVQAGLMGGWQEQLSIAHASTLMLPITFRSADARSWNQPNGNNDYFYGHHRRVLVDDTTPQVGELARLMAPAIAIDPVTGIKGAIQPLMSWESARPELNNEVTRVNRFVQLAANMDLFKNRVVLIAAGRRDLVNADQKLGNVTADYPAGWQGDYYTWLPKAPKDFDTLIYTPKNAAGKATGAPTLAVTRPRTTVNGINARAPQYGNDRFQSDYSPPEVVVAQNTYTLGTVVNVTRSIGFYFNRSTTFNPTASGILARGYDQKLIPPTTSLGHDAGIRFTLPNGKFSGSIARFWGETKNTTGGGQSFDVSPIQGYAEYRDVPAVGNLNPIGDNLNNIVFAGSSTRDRETWGYEFEGTANLTSSWRLTTNVGITYLKVSKAFTNVLPAIEAFEPSVRKQLQEAGIVFDGQNHASINPAVNDPTKINQAAVQAAVAAWNTQHDITIPTLRDLAASGGNVVTDTGWKANLATDYRFRRGALNGLRVGLGVNYFPPMILGERSRETIRNSANPNQAIDDPNTDISSFLRSPSYFRTMGTLSYTLRLIDSRRIVPKSIQFDLTIDNLFNDHDVIYPRGTSSSFQGSAPTLIVPRSGDITDPSRILVKGTPVYPDPRSFQLSAKMSF